MGPPAEEGGQLAGTQPSRALVRRERLHRWRPSYRWKEQEAAPRTPT